MHVTFIRHSFKIFHSNWSKCIGPDSHGFETSSFCKGFLLEQNSRFNFLHFFFTEVVFFWVVTEFSCSWEKSKRTRPYRWENQQGNRNRYFPFQLDFVRSRRRTQTRNKSSLWDALCKNVLVNTHIDCWFWEVVIGAIIQLWFPFSSCLTILTIYVTSSSNFHLLNCWHECACPNSISQRSL